MLQMGKKMFSSLKVEKALLAKINATPEKIFHKTEIDEYCIIFNL